MPAPVPPGFTRGPIIFLGPMTTTTGEAQLLQRFWSEAGGYGARLLFLTTRHDHPDLERLRRLFVSWEVETVATLVLERRAALFDLADLQVVEQATGILLLEEAPDLLARLLGGTPLAQAIRRANARNKSIGAIGSSAGFLCQHMALPASGDEISFAPGLGLVNRLTIVPAAKLAGDGEHELTALLAAVRPNPFLVALHLGTDTGVVLYPDSTLEVFGKQKVLLMDSASTQCDDVRQLTSESELAQHHIQLYRMGVGATFNFDQRTMAPPTATDIPASGVPTTSKNPN